MAPKIGNAPRPRKAALRFVLIAPKPARLLEFSDRLLQGGAVRRARGSRGKWPAQTRPAATLSFARRIAAFLIAALFLCAGLAAMLFGAREGEWLSGALGAAAFLYGIGWSQAVCRGTMADGRLHLNPWRGR
jgi:hypothetical protein